MHKIEGIIGKGEDTLTIYNGMTFDLDLSPTDLNINRDHVLINDYLLTKFEVSGAI